MHCGFHVKCPSKTHEFEYLVLSWWQCFGRIRNSHDCGLMSRSGCCCWAWEVIAISGFYPNGMFNGQLVYEQANLKFLLLWTRASSVTMAPTAADRAAPCFPATVGHTPWHCGQNKTTLHWAAFVISSVIATRKAVLRFDTLMWGHAVSEPPLLCWKTEEELELGREKPYKHLKPLRRLHSEFWTWNTSTNMDSDDTPDLKGRLID